MSASMDVDVARLNHTVINDTRHGPYLRADTYHHVPDDEDEEIYVVSEMVVLRAGSLKELHDWLSAAVEDVRREIIKDVRARYAEPGEVDVDAAAADTGALA